MNVIAELPQTTALYRPETQKYGAILVDPPWQFRVWSRDTGLGRSAESHYSTLTLDDLKALPMQNLMAKHCAVFLWATWPTLLEAISLGAAWGLTYKTCAFLWSKTNKNAVSSGNITDDKNWFFGMGYWSRANSEPCLLFTRGNPKRKPEGGKVRQLIVAPIREHSQKPDEAYSRIDALVDGPYIEIFARQRYPNWEAIGNEIDKRDIRDVLPAPVLTQSLFF